MSTTLNKFTLIKAMITKLALLIILASSAFSRVSLLKEKVINISSKDLAWKEQQKLLYPELNLPENRLVSKLTVEPEIVYSILKKAGDSFLDQFDQEILASERPLDAYLLNSKRFNYELFSKSNETFDYFKDSIKDLSVLWTLENSSTEESKIAEESKKKPDYRALIKEIEDELTSKNLFKDRILLRYLMFARGFSVPEDKLDVRKMSENEKNELLQMSLEDVKWNRVINNRINLFIRNQDVYVIELYSEIQMGFNEAKTLKDRQLDAYIRDSWEHIMKLKRHDFDFESPFQPNSGIRYEDESILPIKEMFNGPEDGVTESKSYCFRFIPMIELSKNGSFVNPFKKNRIKIPNYVAFGKLRRKMKKSFSIVDDNDLNLSKDHYEKFKIGQAINRSDQNAELVVFDMGDPWFKREFGYNDFLYQKEKDGPEPRREPKVIEEAVSFDGELWDELPQFDVFFESEEILDKKAPASKKNGLVRKQRIKVGRKNSMNSHKKAKAPNFFDEDDQFNLEMFFDGFDNDLKEKPAVEKNEKKQRIRRLPIKRRKSQTNIIPNIENSLFANLPNSDGEDSDAESINKKRRLRLQRTDSDAIDDDINEVGIHDLFKSDMLHLNPRKVRKGNRKPAYLLLPASKTKQLL